MTIFETTQTIQKYLTKYSKIGFVPTMGALHQGHLSLLEQSLKENDISVISIFVNPTQFNNKEDLDKYPRTLERDIEQIKTISEEIIVFAPSVKEIYANNISSTTFSFDGLEFEMEGKHRPGHFDGVGTIVKRLFEIINPTNAYFGEKDFQQLQIVKKLVETNNLPIKIIGCPIFREKSGLAMSSRNERLSDTARINAAFISETLNNAKEFFKNHTIEETIKFVENKFKERKEFELEYFDIADEKTLKSINVKEQNNSIRGFIAVYLEGIRLIDNLSFN